MKARFSLLASSLLVCLVAGCSSSPASSSPVDDGGPSSDSVAADSVDESTVADTSSPDIVSLPEAPAASLKAPKLTMLMKMMGVLHTMWTNNQTDCDAVEIERKDDTSPYKRVYSVAGDIDNKMDSGASANMTYTYRLRCKKGADYSPYSNEMSANPTN